MKKLMLFTLLLSCLGLAFAGEFTLDAHSGAADAAKYVERAPLIGQQAETGNRASFDLQFSYTQTDFEYGLSSDGTYLYTSYWNQDGKFGKYSLGGSFIEIFTVPGAAGIRDFTYDGQYFYGAANSTTIYIMDFGTNTLIGTIPAPFGVRGIAYDSDNDGFWISSGWTSTCNLISRSGAVLQTLTLGGDSNGGLGYDKFSGTPTLWGNAETGTSLNTLTQYSLADGAILQTFDLATAIPEVNFEYPAGGMDICVGLVPGKVSMVGVSQSLRLYGLELCDAPLADTHTYKLELNVVDAGYPGKGEWAITGPAGTYNVTAGTPYWVEYNTNVPENALVGTYTIAAAPAGYHWVENPIIVGMYDFHPIVNKYTYIYEGSIEFELVKDPVTPVELSSFTATLTGGTYVQLNWTSQTETMMMGYRVYRNTSADQPSSIMINQSLIPATNTSSTQNYSLVDNEVEISQTYYYWLEAVDYISSSYHGPVSVSVTGEVPPVCPEFSSMKNAYPNPFNASANIEVSLKAGEHGTVSIYNVQGQMVKSFSVSEGTHNLSWNGMDSRNNACSSGIYFYKLSTASINQTRKLMFVK